MNRLEPLRCYIVEAIERGTMPPGSKLPTERELAAQFGLSRSAVREALTPLELAGRIKREVGRGTFVLGAHPAVAGADVHIDASPNELIDAALSCYPFMAELAARNGTRADLDAVATSAALVHGATTDEDYRQADTAFHLAIAKATHNPVLVELASVIVKAQLRIHWGDVDPNRHGVEDHDRIVEALFRRNGRLAKLRMEEHLSGARAIAAAFESETSLT